MPQSPLALTRYRASEEVHQVPDTLLLRARSSSTPNGAIPSGCRLPLFAGTKSGHTLTFHRGGSIAPAKALFDFQACAG